MKKKTFKIRANELIKKSHYFVVGVHNRLNRKISIDQNYK